MNKTCADCIHYEVCKRLDSIFKYHNAPSPIHLPTICGDFFKPKSRYIELPCELGQTIYDVTEFVSGAYAPEMYEMRANEITIEKERNGKIAFVYDGLYVYPDEIGKTVFLTKEEAEQALLRKEDEGK